MNNLTSGAALNELGILFPKIEKAKPETKSKRG
jgi:hypothetical protein